MRLCREKTGRAKAQLEINLPNAIKKKKKKIGGFSVYFGLKIFVVLFGTYLLWLLGIFPVGISPVNDTILSYFYKILASITVQHTLFFTSYALRYCSLGPLLDIEKL